MISILISYPMANYNTPGVHALGSWQGGHAYELLVQRDEVDSERFGQPRVAGIVDAQPVALSRRAKLGVSCRVRVPVGRRCSDVSLVMARSRAADTGLNINDPRPQN
jgi:hypothetical protein